MSEYLCIFVEVDRVRTRNRSILRIRTRSCILRSVLFPAQERMSEADPPADHGHGNAADIPVRNTELLKDSGNEIKKVSVMNQDRVANQKYNEKQVGKLIQRATELHEQFVGESEQSLSLKEIEEIASELGLPSRFIQEAALELKEGNDSDNSFSLWGAPFVVHQTRVAEGIMTEREWEEIQLELQNFSGKTGTTRQTGSTYQWSHAVGEGEEGFNFEKTQVTVRPVNGRTSIRIRKYYDGAVAMYVLAFGLTSFLTLMVAHSLPDVAKLAELLYAGFAGMTSLGVVRALISKSARNYRTKLSQLADRLLQIVDKSASLDSEVKIRGGKLEMPDHDEFLQEKDEIGESRLPAERTGREQ